MIVEQRTYTLKPDHTPAQFIAVYEQLGLTLQVAHLGNLIGYFLSDIGVLNQIVFLWGYSDLNDRAGRRASLAAEPEWEAYLNKVRPMLAAMESRVLVPASSSPLR